MFKGLIFDMDGTMIDNMMVHHRAWMQKLAEYGLIMTIDEVKEKVHGVNHEILEKLFGDRFSQADRKRISDEKEAAYREIFLPQLKLVNGLNDFLENAKNKNIPMAIGTAAPPENAHLVLENLHLHHYFEGIFHSESVTHGKPDPEIFHLAAQSMGLDPSDCLVFEDSITGVEAARRAGAKAIVVTTTHQENEFAHFNHIVDFIDDFTELNLW